MLQLNQIVTYIITYYNAIISIGLLWWLSGKEPMQETRV